jgi:ABC-2 type transport system ATP-binding protein
VTAAVEARGLVKRYGRVRGLEDLSLRVEAGEVFGFLGPNGAGKTTTIRLLLGLLTPSAGSAAMLGHEVRAGDVGWRRDVGYLPGELSFWPGLSGRRTLEFLAALTGRPPARRAELLQRLQLAETDLDRPVRTYSDGMKQKLGIVQALQCEPRLVLLDEPTKGLDPLVQQAFYEILLDLRRREATVFFSSHVLPEVERICDRIAMLRSGRLVSVGNIEQLRSTMPRRVIAVFGEDGHAAGLAAFGRVVVVMPRRIELMVSVAQVPGLVTRLGGLPLLDLAIEPPTLEELFLEHYK